MKKKALIALAAFAVALTGAGAAYALAPRGTVTVNACVGPLGLTRLNTTCVSGLEHPVSWVGNGYSTTYAVMAQGVGQIFVQCHDGDNATGGGGFARNATTPYAPMAVSAPANRGFLADDSANSWWLRSVSPGDDITGWVLCIH
jgi:hypothetical protein